MIFFLFLRYKKKNRLCCELPRLVICFVENNLNNDIRQHLNTKNKHHSNFENIFLCRWRDTSPLHISFFLFSRIIFYNHVIYCCSTILFFPFSPAFVSFVKEQIIELKNHLNKSMGVEMEIRVLASKTLTLLVKLEEKMWEKIRDFLFT